MYDEVAEVERGQENETNGDAMIPRPGSDEAIEQGCICPILDNGHGKGCGWKDDNGEPLYWITEFCPLHWNKVSWDKLDWNKEEL